MRRREGTNGAARFMNSAKEKAMKAPTILALLLFVTIGMAQEKPKPPQSTESTRGVSKVASTKTEQAKPAAKENLSPGFAKAAFMAVGAIYRYDGTAKADREMEEAIRAAEFEVVPMSKDPDSADFRAISVLKLLRIDSMNDYTILEIARAKAEADAYRKGGTSREMDKAYTESLLSNLELDAVHKRQAVCKVELDKRLKARVWPVDEPSLLPAACEAPPVAAQTPPNQSVPDQAQARATAAPARAPAAEFAWLRVYRARRFVGSALAPSIYVDDKQVARVGNGRRVTIRLAVGLHSIRSDDKSSAISLDVKPGQEYYLRVDEEPGFWKGHGKLTLMMPEQGAPEFKLRKSIEEDRKILKEIIEEEAEAAPGKPGKPEKKD